MLRHLTPLLLLLWAPVSLVHAGPQGELITNGDFETGDTTGWQVPAPGNLMFTVGPYTPHNGAFCGWIYKTIPNAPATIQQTNLGVGVVQPGDPIEVSFAVRLFATNTRVFVELVSESTGTPPSSTELLGGGPLPLSAPCLGWRPFSFTTTAGPVVSGGLTLRITAKDPGFNPFDLAGLFIDDVSVKGALPVPGAAYCFGDGTGVACPCNNTGPAGAGCANSSACGAVLAATGTASFSNDSFALGVAGVANNKPGLVLRGDNPVALPAGDGILCTSGGTQRSQVQVTATGATTFTDFNGAPFGSVANVGAPTNFQFWYRDPLGSPCGGGFNFSNGWTVTYQP